MSTRSLIVRDGKLLCLRETHHCIDGEVVPKWGFPGGGVEPGEFVWDTVKRECREELGVEVEVGPVRAIAYAVFKDGNHGLRFAVQTTLKSDAFVLEEGTTVHWYALEEARQLTGRKSPGFDQFVELAFTDASPSPALLWLRDTEPVDPPSAT